MGKTKKIALLLFLALSLFLNFSSCRKKTKKRTVKYDKTLVFYNMHDDSRVFLPLIQEFKQKYKVNIEYKKFTNLKSYENQLISEMAEGGGPDIFAIHNSWSKKHKGKISPASEEAFLANDFRQDFAKVAVEDFVMKKDKEAFTEDKKSSKKAKTAKQRKAEEKKLKKELEKDFVFAVPMGISTLGLFYNEKYFVNNIISRKTPASTWEEFKEDVYKMTRLDKGNTGFKVNGFAGGRGENIRRGAEIFYSIFLQNRGKFYSNKGITILAESQSGNTPGIDSLNLLRDFTSPSSKYYTWNEISADPQNDMKEIEGFLNDKVAIIAGYPYLYERIYEKAKAYFGSGNENYINPKNIRTAPMPQLESDKKYEKSVYASYFGLTVSKNSENTELAWKFIKFLSSQKSLEHYFEETHLPSARLELLSKQIRDPIYGPFAEQVSFAKSFFAEDLAYFNKTVSQAIDKVADGEKDPKEALKEAQGKIENFLSESRGESWDDL